MADSKSASLEVLDAMNGEVFSVENIARYGATQVSAFEENMKVAIDAIKGQDSRTIDQGTLLTLQMNVQNWSVLISTMTGLMRCIGDGMAKVTQNIR
ncbi:MAG: hypothetical protein LBT57_02640 [Puniceicoccales bacterium]|jgi:hypothetical protein|nr:hypothetical protein [Puniceicoccales bacterium]